MTRILLINDTPVHTGHLRDSLVAAGHEVVVTTPSLPHPPLPADEQADEHAEVVEGDIMQVAEAHRPAEHIDHWPISVAVPCTISTNTSSQR